MPPPPCSSGQYAAAVQAGRVCQQAACRRLRAGQWQQMQQCGAHAAMSSVLSAHHWGLAGGAVCAAVLGEHALHDFQAGAVTEGYACPILGSTVLLELAPQHSQPAGEVLQALHPHEKEVWRGRQAGQYWLGAVCPAAEERGLGKLTLLALAGAGTFCDQSGQSSPLTHSLAGREGKEAAADGCAVVLHG